MVEWHDFETSVLRRAAFPSCARLGIGEPRAGLFCLAKGEANIWTAATFFGE